MNNEATGKDAPGTATSGAADLHASGSRHGGRTERAGARDGRPRR
ncbi:hypothetical protein [Georgenia sp. SUBG003]